MTKKPCVPPTILRPIPLWVLAPGPGSKLKSILVPADYRFIFDLGIPGDLKHPSSLGAFHSDKIEYVFGTLDSRKGYAWRPEDYKLSELIQTYWTNFAKTGNPNSDGLPNWPTYNAKDGWLVMHFGQPSSAQPDAHRDRYLFLPKAWNN